MLKAGTFSIRVMVVLKNTTVTIDLFLLCYWHLTLCVRILHPTDFSYPGREGRSAAFYCIILNPARSAETLKRDTDLAEASATDNDLLMLLRNVRQDTARVCGERMEAGAPKLLQKWKISLGSQGIVVGVEGDPGFCQRPFAKTPLDHFPARPPHKEKVGPW